MANPLIKMFKGTYAVRCEYDKSTNQFGRDLKGNLEDIDCYVDCQNGTKVFYYGRNKLDVYVPSTGRLHNIMKALDEIRPNIYFEAWEGEGEGGFKFNPKDNEIVMPMLKPKVSACNRSPFSPKNLYKNKDFVIPEDKLVAYKNIVAKIPQKDVFCLSRMTPNYVKSLATKKFTYDAIKAEMAKLGLDSKQYIFYKGKWDDYLDYLAKNIKELGE